MRECTMRTRKILSGLLVFSIVLSALPVSAEPAGTSLAAAPASPAPSTFRASLDRAAASAALVGELPTGTPYGPATRKMMPSPQFAAEAAGGGGQAASGGGGGMSKVSLIITLVGTAAGIGATVYMLKQMKKATGAIAIPNVPK
jgi:hypothetical protein